VHDDTNGMTNLQRTMAPHLKSVGPQNDSFSESLEVGCLLVRDGWTFQALNPLDLIYSIP